MTTSSDEPFSARARTGKRMNCRQRQRAWRCQCHNRLRIHRMNRNEIRSTWKTDGRTMEDQLRCCGGGGGDWSVRLRWWRRRRRRRRRRRQGQQRVVCEGCKVAKPQGPQPSRIIAVHEGGSLSAVAWACDVKRWWRSHVTSHSLHFKSWLAGSVHR